MCKKKRGVTIFRSIIFIIQSFQSQLIIKYNYILVLNINFYNKLDQSYDMKEDKMDLYMSGKPEEVMPEDVYHNYLRNKSLVDLGEIPEEIKIAVLESYNAQEKQSSAGLFNYFIEKKLRNLIEHINDF